MENGLAIHMLTEKKYPLSQELLSKMLSKKLEVDHESSQAFELLRFIRSQEKELILLMVKAADLEISMHGDYYGMLNRSSVGIQQRKALPLLLDLLWKKMHTDKVEPYSSHSFLEKQYTSYDLRSYDPPFCISCNRESYSNHQLSDWYSDRVHT
ncbi:hypothetical protein Tco_0011614 [Tanacetum coccineum]